MFLPLLMLAVALIFLPSTFASDNVVQVSSGIHKETLEVDLGNDITINNSTVDSLGLGPRQSSNDPTDFSWIHNWVPNISLFLL